MRITIAMTKDDPQLGFREFELTAYVYGQEEPFMRAQIFVRLSLRPMMDTSLSAKVARTSAERRMVAELANKVNLVCDLLEVNPNVNNPEYIAHHVGFSAE